MSSSAVACNPCPFVSGAFGLVPGKDKAVTNFQSRNLLSQNAKVCQLDVCEQEQGDIKGNSIYLQKNENQAIPNDTTSHLVIFDKVVRSGLEGYDTSTGIFTAPVTGNYSFTYQILWNASAGNKSLFIRREPFTVAADAQQFVETRDVTFQGQFPIAATLFVEQGSQIGFRVEVFDDGGLVLALSGSGFPETELEIVLHE